MSSSGVVVIKFPANISFIFLFAGFPKVATAFLTMSCSDIIPTILSSSFIRSAPTCSFAMSLAASLSVLLGEIVTGSRVIASATTYPVFILYIDGVITAFYINIVNDVVGVKFKYSVYKTVY